MKYTIDTHTHTLVSGHAYNTIDEMAAYAAGIGVTHLAITDHAPKMPGSAGILYFSNMKIIPREKCGVRIYMGCEANIMDYDGNIDLKEYGLKGCDVVIASLHIPCIKPGSIEQNTNALIKAMDNPYVNIIGHPDDSRYPVDYEKLVKAAKEFNSKITLTKDGKSGDCKKIFGIMALAVKCGNEVTITVEGEDEEAAAAKIEEFMKSNM